METFILQHTNLYLILYTYDRFQFQEVYVNGTKRTSIFQQINFLQFSVLLTAVLYIFENSFMFNGK